MKVADDFEMSINGIIAKKILIENNGLEKIFFFATIPFFLSGFIGNVLVMRIVHKKRTMHTKTNYLLVTLALSDIITIFMAVIIVLKISIRRGDLSGQVVTKKGSYFLLSFY